MATKAAQPGPCAAMARVARKTVKRWLARAHPSPYALLSLACCAVAWLLRLFWAGRQSLWYDEALSVAQSVQPLPNLIVDLIQSDVHPPLYFTILHFWIMGAGSAELAVRSLSAWCGTLAVAAVIVVTTRLAGRPAGLIAGFLACFSPLLVYYGQETRMYALLAALSALAGYGFLRASAGERRWWPAYVPLMAAALWTQLYGAFLFAALNAWYVRRALRRLGHPRRTATQAQAARLGIVAPGIAGNGWTNGDRLVRYRIGRERLVAQWPAHRAWLGAQCAVALLFLPWAPVAWYKLHAYVNPGHGTPLDQVLRETAMVFALGFPALDVAALPRLLRQLPEPSATALLLLPFLLCLALGMLAASRKGRSALIWWLTLPIVGIYVSSLGQRDFNARYLMEAAPAYFALLAVGLAWCWRALGRPFALLLGAALAGVTVLMLAGLYGDPFYARDDNRQVVALVSQGAAPGAGVVLDAAYTERAFDYYAQGRWPVSDLPTPVFRDPAAAVASLTQFTAGRPQVWLVLWQDYYSDPREVVWNWLLHHFYATDWQGVHGGLKLLRFDALPSSGIRPSSVTFGGVLQLVAFSTTPVRAVTDGNDQVQLDLYWQFLARPGADLAIAAHLLDDAGNNYGDADGQPAGGHLPTTAFTAGEQLHTVERLTPRPWTAAGAYRVQIVVYDPRTMQPLAASGTGADPTSLMLPLTLPPTEGRAPSPALLPPATTAVGATADGAGLLAGYQVAGQGEDTVLTLFWRAAGPSQRPLKVFAHALDGQGRVLATGDADPVDGAAPTTTWRAGELVRDPHHLRLPDVRAVAAYEVGIYDPETGDRLPIRLADGTTPGDRAVRLVAGR